MLVEDGSCELMKICNPIFSEYIKQREFKRSILGQNDKHVLADVLVKWLINYTCSTIQICQRVDHDKKEIMSHFSLDVRLIEKIIIGQGDRHLDGASTCELLFRHGKTLYYKPRSLGMEIQFGILAESLCNQLNIQPYNPIPMSVDMGSHGYQRKIEINAAIKECDTLNIKTGLLVVLIDVQVPSTASKRI